MKHETPLIIPNFNQLTFLKNAINWFHWYYPDFPVFVVDNGSDYAPLLEYYSLLEQGVEKNVRLFRYPENNFRANLADFIERGIKPRYEYYAISDADIQPHPATPPDFLKAFKRYIDQGYHRAGFNLITHDLPEWLNERAMIVGNEVELLTNQIGEYQGFPAYKAPLDTTFCLYTTKNSGWQSPMNGRDWGNSIRVFNAVHWGWYVNGEHLNPEMENYFKTAKYRVPGEPSAGSNNNRPKQFQ